MAVHILVIGLLKDETRQRFSALPGSIVTFAKDPQQLAAEDLSDVEIFVGFLSRELLARMPSLRFVQLFSAGAERFTWLPENIILANAYGAYGSIIAEHMLTTTLMAMKRMPEYLSQQDRQEWTLLKGIDRFEGAHILSVGMGAIGTAYLEKAAALGAVVYGVRRTIHDKPAFVKELITPDELDSLLPQMDVIALSLPGSPSVDRMFDERRLRLMKKSAILLNTGRGNAVVTDDLIRVMADGHLKAACLDAMTPEPLPEGHPLWTAPRVYITPHISGGFRAGVNYDSVMDIVLKNVKLVLDGKDPVHIVDRALGY